jgi:O-antigen/teichoic acid export membrane protein
VRPISDQAPASLRANVAATFAGNALFALSQWAILSLIAKLGDARMLGEYALATAIAAPVAMLSHLSLRAVLATDVAGRRPFGDYLAVRLGTVAAGLAVIAGLALASGQAAVTVAVGLALSLDNVSDIYYGLLQRRERMDQVARSMVARGLLSAAGLGVTLWLTHSLLAAVALVALARAAVLAAYDRPRASAGESLARTSLRNQFAIFRTALPLGIALMLISLTANLPRYAIERRLGTAELGAFAAAASFLTVGGTAVNALGQAATPRLAKLIGAGDVRGFRRLVWRLSGLALLLGAAGVGAAALAGRFVLAVAYRPAYAAYSGLLVWIMAASPCYYVASTLAYAITSARSFAAQAPLLAVVAATAAAASWTLVPRWGLNGAALALALAWMVQIAGELWILRVRTGAV